MSSEKVNGRKTHKWEGGTGHINCRGARRYHGVNGSMEEHDHAGLMVVSPPEGHIGLSQTGARFGGKNI